MEFAYDGDGIAKGGKVSLFIDGKNAGEGRIDQTEPFAFGEETCDVGHEGGSPVTGDYAENGGTRFSGKVNWVEFDAGIAADDQNHLITPEERLQVAMAKQ
jgi:arylsulfatase